MATSTRYSNSSATTTGVLGGVLGAVGLILSYSIWRWVVLPRLYNGYYDPEKGSGSQLPMILDLRTDDPDIRCRPQRKKKNKEFAGVEVILPPEKSHHRRKRKIRRRQSLFRTQQMPNGLFPILENLSDQGHDLRQRSNCPMPSMSQAPHNNHAARDHYRSNMGRPKSKLTRQADRARLQLRTQQDSWPRPYRNTEMGEYSVSGSLPEAEKSDAVNRLAPRALTYRSNTKNISQMQPSNEEDEESADVPFFPISPESGYLGMAQSDPLSSDDNVAISSFLNSLSPCSLSAAGHVSSVMFGRDRSPPVESADLGSLTEEDI
ncbi:hypothetical protein M501DRAFT_986948 [Patellaria atrata CBS 101060]|uniref:Uncharacterized protein n=1 Tax=Patellaria atrata CBS 101060 TaxID=1346257 RepID=A0A9P4S7M5_9PEZI|nr:hypothetical protein M501DRAFT_986948 [Patellaria atrata CBS 101060]